MPWPRASPASRSRGGRSPERWWRWAPGSETPEDVVALSGRAAYVVGWCGMRGTVTLAAALALPSGFPYRDLIFFTSFAVVLVTLVVQP